MTATIGIKHHPYVPLIKQAVWSSETSQTLFMIHYTNKLEVLLNVEWL